MQKKALKEDWRNKQHTRKKINKMTNNSNYVKNKTKCEWTKQSDEKTHCQTGIKKKKRPQLYISYRRHTLHKIYN